MKKIIIFISFLVIFCSCSEIESKNSLVTRDGFYLDTYVQITIFDGNENILDETFDLIEKYDLLFSSYIDGNDIDKINKSFNKFITVDNKTIELLEKSLYFAEKFEGNFDPTIGSVSLLWDFKEETVPSEATILQNLAGVSYKNVEIKDNSVKILNKNTKLDLGAIAKGFITDELVDYLRTNKVQSAIINLGGNVFVIGEKIPEYRPFKVGIRKPAKDSMDYIGTVEVSDKSVVTSGIYERFFVQDENFYHHILDPNTGYPAESDILSTTIISDTSVEGDALSTYSFILGVEKTLEYVNSQDNLYAIIIDQDNIIHYSDGISDDIVFKINE